MALDESCKCGIPHCSECGQIYYCGHLTREERHQTTAENAELRAEVKRYERKP